MNQTRKNYTKDKYYTDIDQQKQLAVATEKTRRAREKRPIREDRELERRIASQKRKKRIQAKKTQLDTEVRQRNESILSEYKIFLSEHPNSLPESQVFTEINSIYTNLFDTLKDNRDLIHEDKINALYTLYGPSSETTILKNYLKMKDFYTPITVNLANKEGLNLYNFITKVLYYAKRDVFNIQTKSLKIPEIKSQLYVDLPRLGNLIINDVYILKNGQLDINNGFINDITELTPDKFNEILITEATKQDFAISINCINLFDLFCIQQPIQVSCDLFLHNFYERKFYQLPGVKTYRLVLNKNQQYVECSIKSGIWNQNVPLAIEATRPPSTGTFTGTLKANIKDLSYTFTVNVNIQKPSPEELELELEPEVELRHQEQGKILSSESTSKIQQLANKISNPVLAAGIGSTLVLVSAGLLTALLGGSKKKKYLHKKRLNKNTRKNTRNTRKNKIIYKNKNIV